MKLPAPGKPLLIGIAVCALIVVWILFGKAVALALSPILAIFKLFGRNKQKAAESKIIAQNHESLNEQAKPETEAKIKAVEQERAELNKIADNIEKLPDEPKPGKTRKIFKIR